MTRTSGDSRAKGMSSKPVNTGDAINAFELSGDLSGDLSGELSPTTSSSVTGKSIASREGHFIDSDTAAPLWRPSADLGLIYLRDAGERVDGSGGQTVYSSARGSLGCRGPRFE